MAIFTLAFRAVCWEESGKDEAGGAEFDLDCTVQVEYLLYGVVVVTYSGHGAGNKEGFARSRDGVLCRMPRRQMISCEFEDAIAVR